MSRPTVALIHSGALKANFARLRALVPSSTEIMAVVKADGYGHGAVPIATVLEEAGAEWFAVATIDEGVELREAGIRKPILVLTGETDDEADAAIEYDLDVAIIDGDALQRVTAKLYSKRLRVHLKLDTGMGRLGVQEADWPDFFETARQTPGIDVVGLFSHFADADSVTTEFTDSQHECFRRGLTVAQRAGLQPRFVHLANSAAILTRSDVFFDAVRPGISLYGIAPGASSVTLGPVMSLETKIWQLKDVPAGRPLSYGQTCITRRPSRIAVLPIGYADGYDRGLSNRGEVVVRGRRAPIVGRVCMDLTLVDVTDIEGVEATDRVTLWGADGLGVDEVARWQDSIAYEVLTRLGGRVPRRLV